MYVLWLTAGTQRVKNGFEQSQQPTTEVLWLVFLKCALIKSAVVMDLQCHSPSSPRVSLAAESKSTFIEKFAYFKWIVQLQNG